MRIALRIVSLASLVLLIMPSILFLAGRVNLDQVKWVMLVATIIWFATATPVMWKGERQHEPEEDEAIIP